MLKNTTYYDLFFRIIEKYGPAGFAAIDDNDPLMIELNEIMDKNHQFFYIGDLILYKILYTSKQCKEMLGIMPADLSPVTFFQLQDPAERERDNLCRRMLIKISHELYDKEKGHTLLSSNFRMKNADGNYSHYLMQFFIYYSTSPNKSVYILKVQTNIDSFKKYRHGFHYYLGNDLTNFRYPDRELLMKGSVFTKREFDIIKLLAKGLTSRQISDKLFLSPNTINTHRRNILKKSDKDNMQQLIHELQENGLI
jgi:DNA-binding CsgD family transcriptional regulator